MNNSDDDNSPLAEPLAELCARLREARDYQRGRDRSHDKDVVHGGRLAAIVALDAVLDFLEHVPAVRQDKLHEPLANLKHAMLDYETGLNPALFERPAWAGGGRKPKPSDRMVLRAAAAVAMEWYIRAGHDRDAAADHVAHHLNRPEINADHVARWRDHANAGLPSEDLDADFYRHFTERPVGYEKHEVFAQRLLKWYAARYPAG